jgi:hypothetical protein
LVIGVDAEGDAGVMYDGQYRVNHHNVSDDSHIFLFVEETG